MQNGFARLVESTEVQVVAGELNSATSGLVIRYAKHRRRARFTDIRALYSARAWARTLREQYLYWPYLSVIWFTWPEG